MPFYDVLAFRNIKRNGEKWEPLEPIKVHTGKALEVGYSTLSKLIGVGDDLLVDPNTGLEFVRTRKDKAAGELKHYYNAATGILINAYTRMLIKGDE